MMNNHRPKVGLLLFTAEWFTQIGASQGVFRDLPNLLQADALRIEQALEDRLEIFNPGILATRQQVVEAAKHFTQIGLDAIVVCYITWGEDRLIIELVQQMPNTPLMLWCYTPYRKLPDVLTMTDLFRSSGPVGSVQASAPLKRLTTQFGFTFGSYENPETIRKITAFCKAAKVANGLRHLTVGVLPYRCDQMTGTYIDEFRLKKELGPELKYITSYDYRMLCNQIANERVEAFIQELRNTYSITNSVTQVGLERAARVSMGLVDVVKNYALGAIAIDDVGEDLHKQLGLRPCLAPPGLFEKAVVSMEAEVGGAVALWILRELTGKPAMYTEIFTYDESENSLLMGHAGIHDLQLVDRPEDVLIEPDGEYQESEPDSAWMRFRAKGGHVTILSLFCDVSRFKMIISSGEAIGGDVKLLGSPHIYVKIDTPLPEFFEKAIRTGMTQHWMVVHDDVIDELVALAEILNLDKTII